MLPPKRQVMSGIVQVLCSRYAASAVEVLMLFECQPPDILISDIGMPDMDGYMLMQQIRGRSPQQGGNIRQYSSVKEIYLLRQAVLEQGRLLKQGEKKKA